MDYLYPILKSVVALFVIMDPFTSLPPFIALTKKMQPKERAAAALTATLVAGATLVGFTLIGMQLLNLLAIRLESFQIAGGLLLLLMAIQIVFNMDFGKEGKSSSEISAAVVLIGFPLLTGPGAMTTSILLSSAYGLFTVLIAALIATSICYLILRMGNPLSRLLGRQGMEISSRVMGILLAAIGVEFIRIGLGM